MRARKRGVWLIALAVLAGSGASGGEARAEPRGPQEAARGRFQEAQRLMQAQSWREALELLREVAKAAESASVRYSMALCEENLGLFREALGDYAAALERASDPSLDPGLKPATRRFLQEESRQSLDALGQRVPVARVERLPVGGAEARYLLDGEGVTASELVRGVRVDPGQHLLRAEAPGKRAIEVSFRADERDRLVITVESRFEPLVPSSVPAPRPAAPPAEGRAKGWRAPAGWVGVGVGATLLGAGLVASLRVRGIGQTQRNDPALQAYGANAVLRGYEGRCDAAEAGVAFEGRGIASPGRVERLCSAQATLRPLQYVFYGAGALFGGAGAYLLLSPEGGATTARGAVGAARWWVLPGLGPGPLGGSVGGVF